MRLFVIGGMALRDYLHERTLSACGVLALAAMLAPLLILFGVRNGVIGNLQERLIRDPRNLEIVPVGSGKYGGAFFEELRQRADVGYAVPQTRSIAATIGLLEKDGKTLPMPRRIEGFVTHLADHDWVISVPAAQWTGGPQPQGGQRQPHPLGRGRSAHPTLCR